MALWDLNLLADDEDFLDRCMAAAALEHVADNAQESWVRGHRHDLAAQPGFADAYASALVSGVPTPGRDPAVITDAQIQAGVVAVAGGGA